MKRTRPLMWAAVAVLAAVSATIYLGHRMRVACRTPLTCCIDEPGTGGGLAWARWAERLGYTVRALRRPLWEAVATLPSPIGNCAITAGNGSWSPWDTEMSAAQWQALQDWVERGNTLMVITGRPDELPKPFLHALAHRPHKPNKSSGWESFRCQAAPRTSTVVLDGHRSLAVRADGPRWPDIPKRGTAVGDTRGNVFFRYPFGAGQIGLLLDDFAWTNAGLDRSDNAIVLAAILERATAHHVIAFDEYRHGHGRVESFLTLALTLPGGRSVAWMVCLLGAGYLLARNRRFGPPEPYAEVERRTAMETIDAIADLYQRARAAPLAVDAVARRLQLLARQRGHTTPDIEHALRQARDFSRAESRPAQPREACRLVRHLIQLRKQAYGNRPDF